jgi:hypothetical protein
VRGNEDIQRGRKAIEESKERVIERMKYRREEKRREKRKINGK